MLAQPHPFYLILGAAMSSFINLSNTGVNVTAIEVNVDTAYTRFSLHGDTAIMTGSNKPMISDTFRRSCRVAVAVIARTFTFGCTTLLTSPIRLSALRNVSPLQTKEQLVVHAT